MDDKVFELMTKMYSDLTSRLDSVDNNINGLKNDVNGLKDDVCGLKNDIIRLENKVDTHSKSLFDGYKQTYEKVVDVENQVKNLSSKVETQEVEIKVIKGGKS